MNGTGTKYTVWHYVGCGCAVLLALAILGVGGCFWMVTNWGRRMEAEIKDPAAREAKAKSLLGFDELPEGYHPGISFSVPFMMDMVMLGDRELPAGEDMKRVHDGRDLFDERGFLYFKMRSFGNARQEFRNDMDYDFDAERKVAEGEVEAGGATVHYTADVGTTHVSGESLRSVSAELEIECGDGYVRRAVWFTPVPGTEAEAGPEAETAEADLTGTPADEAALTDFLDHFRFCG
jgi:hypothetical protein